MLVSLALRDVVLIDRLELTLQNGLCVLTGETGAGKSILLDALGLATGARGDASLVRTGPGGTRKQATISAEFAVPPDHPAAALLDANGLDAPGPGEPLILRRVLGGDGRSRAFVNDQPIGIGLLRELGESLVEIEGQFASRGLLNAATHRAALDDFAGIEALAAKTADRHGAWRAAMDAHAAAAAALDKARADEDYLRHAGAELDALDPQPGEDATLAASRTALMNAGKLVAAVADALAGLTGPDGIDSRLGAALGAISRHVERAGGGLDAALDALDRAASEAAEAIARLEAAGAALAGDPDRLESIEERLFALRAAARKHRTDVDSLPALRDEFAASLAALEDSGQSLDALADATEEARTAYLDAAERLSRKRRKAADRLDTAIALELPPLRLDKASFRTVIERLDEGEWGRHGIDRVAFEVATNPGQAPGPLARIASGGELARFMLALKVVLSEASPVPTLVFDEVDSGIGGAAAAAVGERLHRLGETVQVLVVTHSPQVAARGAAHWRVRKHEEDSGGAPNTVTRVDALSEVERREEIARMLAGARITDAARAAAASLIGEHAA